jgi:MFS family permease
MTSGAANDTSNDARRWWTLGFSLLAVTVTVIDNTVLTVSIPQIMRDLDTDVTGVQWIFTGYALTFAALLVIGGRLGDIYGPRRIVILGSALFGLGSLLASMSTSMPQMLLGEAVIEGCGAALLAPNSLSVLSHRFSDSRERAVAFAAWASVIGAAAVVGPLLGGYLTTYHSWRWSFRINVVIAPIVIVGLLLAGGRETERGTRQPLDVRGALLIASGMFLVVFGLTQGNSYGWWQPIDAFTVGGTSVWPESLPISPIPFAFLFGGVLLTCFVLAELTRERGGLHPLFELSQFRHRTFRYANISTFFLSFAQLSLAICIALYLQQSRHLSPMENGLWVMPSGAALLAGAPVGGLLSRRMGPTNTLRLGSLVNLAGLLGLTFFLPGGYSYPYVFPWFVVYGVGGGFVSSQMNRILLHDIAPEHTGAAGGVHTTARQGATALGVAMAGAIFAAVARTKGLDGALRLAMLTGVAAVVISTWVMWKLPQIERDEETSDEDPADLFVLVEPVNARLEA